MPNETYTKRSNGKEGFYELDFVELTPEKISEYKKNSERELEELKFIATNAPELLSAVDDNSSWWKVGYQLNKFDVCNRIINLYAYDGNEYSLSNYFRVRGNIERDMELIITSHLVFLTIRMSFLQAKGDLEEAIKVSQSLFGCGFLLGQAMLEDTACAGLSRTSDATHERSEKSNERGANAIFLAEQIIAKEPSIRIGNLQRRIATQMKLSDRQVRRYLEGAELPILSRKK